MSEAKKTKVLTAARSVFLRYGYRRVNMSDIAEAAGVSRPALYVLFRNREEIFIGVLVQWIDETVAEIEREAKGAASPEEKIERAFDIWAVRPFELTMTSPEAREIIECSFDFAQPALKQGYDRFEAAITPVVALLAGGGKAEARLAPQRVAHVLASAVRGFKQAATTPDELRQLIRDLLILSFGPAS